MIVEIAMLDVRTGMEAEFEAAFAVAQAIAASMPGYLSHEVSRCLERPGRYALVVRWARLEDHTVGLRGSPAYQRWRALLHHFYDPFPTVEHFAPVAGLGAPTGTRA